MPDFGDQLLAWTAVAGLIRWLLRVVFLYEQKSSLKRAQLETSVEQLKSANSVRLISALQLAVDNMKPTLQEHSRLLEGFRHSFDLMQATEVGATELMKELKIQYGNFASELLKFNSIGEDILGRVKSLETEVVILKQSSGNIYIRDKK